MTEPTDWPVRAARLAAQLTETGVLRSPAWRAAVEAVPRHELVPVYYQQDEHGDWRASDTTTPAGQERWLDLVYSDTALYTMVGELDGPWGGGEVGLSSSSQPHLMVRMLEALDVQDGRRVLEIGTGSGYNAALLSHRLGDAHVFSVDIEDELVTLARQRLAALGHHPTLVTADGETGLPEHAPYDRIIVTCAVPRVPWTWVEQTPPGALILVDLKRAIHAGSLVLLRRHDDRAEGRFLPNWAGFMDMRKARAADVRPQPPRNRTEARARTTTLDVVHPWDNLIVWFLACLALPPDFDVAFGRVLAPVTRRPTLAYVSTSDGSWFEITEEADQQGVRRVWEGGPADLWQAVERAYQLWRQSGEPGWERFGVTVARDWQRVWLDTPRGSQHWQI